MYFCICNVAKLQSESWTKLVKNNACKNLRYCICSVTSAWFEIFIFNENAHYNLQLST